MPCLVGGTRVTQEAEGEREYGQVFIMVSVEENRQGGVSGLRIG